MTASPERLMAARMALVAAEAEQRIAACHTEVPCPACGAPVGTRCWPLSGRGYAMKDRGHNKHPHRRRWTQVVPAR